MKKTILAVAVLFALTGTAQASLFGGGDKNTNTNVNTLGQQQGQAQGQIQGQGQAQGQLTNVNVQGGGSQTHVGGQSTSVSQSVNFPERQQVEYSGSYEVQSAPSVYAPSVVSANPCLVTFSGGVSLIGGGLSLGGSTVDEGCEVRALSGQLHAYGHTEAAKQLLCTDPRVAAAYKSAGTPCNVDLQPQAEAGTECYRDEIVAHRMNAPVCQ